MTHIPQIIVYLNPKGEYILETPSDNGGRKRQVLSSDRQTWGEIIAQEITSREYALMNHIDAEELSRSLAEQRKARLENERIAKRRGTIFHDIWKRHGKPLANKVIPSELKSRKGNKPASDERVYDIDLDALQ